MRVYLADWPKIEQFLVLQRGFGTKTQSLAVYKRRYKRFSAWFEHHNFTKKGFIEFLSSMKKEGLKNSYINNFIKIGRLIDRFNDTHVLDEFMFLKEQSTVPKDTLTPNDVLQLANICIPYRYNKDILNQRQQALIMLLGLTGCRIDEALSLEWQDVHENPSFVEFRNTKNGDNRSVPISANLYQEISALPHTSNYVFTGNTGMKVCPQTVNADLKVRAKACGIQKRVWCHLFRHSFITTMIDSGVEWFVLSQIVGHKDPKTTREYYTQSMQKATEIIMQHPLLKPMLAYEQQRNMLKEAVNKIFNDRTATMQTEENENEFLIRLQKR